MKRLLLISMLALVVVPTALAKGPEQTTISGPGLDDKIVFGPTEGGIAQDLGFFATVFGQTPDPRSPRPFGQLGPRYEVAYEMGTSTIRQDLYPYAAGGPLTYVKRGQPYWGSQTVGGWYRASRALKNTLVGFGLPARPPAVSDDSDLAVRDAWPFALAVLALALAAGALFVMRRPGVARA